MLVTTTNSIQDREIITYHGIVTGQTIFGANIFRDFFAGIRDVVGGRSNAYEKVIRDARESALADMQEQARQYGANAVIGVDFDFEALGTKGSMLMVVATGTAVTMK